MDWSNERYVRVYTRDTTTWKIIDWQARTLLLFLLRKVDRSGVLDVGTDGLEGVAALVDLPIDVVERGMPQLIARGVVVKTPGHYVMPKFLEAQEAVQSDAMRQRESREKRRATALGLPDADVTKRDANPGNASLNVTETPDSVTPARPASPSRLSRPREKQKKLSATPLPDGWTPPAGGRTEEAIRARGETFDAEKCLQKLRTKAAKSGWRKQDWDAYGAEWIEMETGCRGKRAAETTGPKERPVVRKPSPPEPKHAYYRVPESEFAAVYTVTERLDHSTYVGTIRVSDGAPVSPGRPLTIGERAKQTPTFDWKKLGGDA